MVVKERNKWGDSEIRSPRLWSKRRWIKGEDSEVPWSVDQKDKRKAPRKLYIRKSSAQ